MKQKIIDFIKLQWEKILIVITVLIVISLLWNLSGVVSTYIHHRKDKSTNNPQSTLIDPSSDVEVLQYAQDWLNYWNPQVLATCYVYNTPVKQCKPNGVKK